MSDQLLDIVLRVEKAYFEMAVHLTRLAHPGAILVVALHLQPVHYFLHEQVLLDGPLVYLASAYGACGGALFDATLAECVPALNAIYPQFR